MADNRKTLPDGLGSPFVNIFDADKANWKFGYNDEFGNPHIELLENYVTSFSYSYDEENDDVCKITLQFTSLLMANGAYIGKDTIINVSWGYKLPGNSEQRGPTRKVAVRNSEYHYTADKIYAVLDCTDLFSYARNLKLNMTSDRDFFEEWLGEVVTGTFVATIDNGDTLTMISQQGKQVEVFDKWTRSLKYEITEGTTLMKVGWKENIIKGHSKAITAQLEDLIQKAEDGPYYIEGRDGIVNIFKRDFSQPYTDSWTLAREHGELISFVSKTNLKLEKLDETESTTINPVTKEIESTSSNYITKPGNPKLTDEELHTAAALARKVYDWNIRHPKNQKSFNGFTVKRSQAKELPTEHTEETLAVQDVIPQTPWVNMRYDIISITAKDIMSTPGFQEAYREATLDNYILKKLERRFTATAVVIGDPTLKTSRTYNFPNLMPHEAGKWYCSKCTHKLTPEGGFIVTMELLRKSDDLGIIRKRIKTKYSESGAPGGTTDVDTTDNDKVTSDNYVEEEIWRPKPSPNQDFLDGLKPGQLQNYLKGTDINNEEYKARKAEEDALIERAFLGQEAWEAAKSVKTEANIFSSTSGYSEDEITKVKNAANDYK